MDKKTFKKHLIEYLETEAMSRREQPVADLIISRLNKNTPYEISYDGFGSLILHKPSKVKNAPKFMVCAHMDEVGYLVRIIDDNGQILVSPVGGIWASVVIGTKATLVTRNDKKHFGVFGHTSIHIMEDSKVSKAITNKELYVDFGFKNKEEALKAGVEVGDPIYMSGETIYFDNPDLVGGKAMDNRGGCMTLEYIAKALEDIDLDVDLYLVGSVQEEVGERGAKTAVSVINPQIAIALDTTTAHDTIGTIKGMTKLGYGAAIRMMDRDMLANPYLAEFMCSIGKKYKIPHYKFVAEGGGTDAAMLQYSQGGAATLTISLPQRYLHSPIGVCDINDLIAAGDLIVETIKNISKSKKF